ncbi:MAG: hypothetical protein QT05_C0009G0002 [archaeon GW2011_AR13]|nr:MAG: hypothetical protein QT05_C0009G0002 [archaeon GW2011_AR13]HIG94440.1 enoyl-CoA hydratase/isomerase family protein [Nanoarchaeota archaeon]HIH62950.1 enoyl-CoA hydratase/isomerase family protein [Nanoarchaeota archaeon]HIJ10353.1 enoyl-CoA hydratase/isomerase family protein [Nanoarchaeota archaeon]
MATTIQISPNLQNELNNLKLFSRETYEEVIWNLIEDREEISKDTKESISVAREQIKRGEVFTLEEVKKELGL